MITQAAHSVESVQQVCVSVCVRVCLCVCVCASHVMRCVALSTATSAMGLCVKRISTRLDNRSNAPLVSYTHTHTHTHTHTVLRTFNYA